VIAEPDLDAPDDDWLVWADAAQQEGDPRGELVALSLEGKLGDGFVRKHGERLVGRTLGRHVRRGDCRITRWRRCYPDEVELRIDDAAKGPQLVVDLLSAPCAERLRGLAIAGVATSNRTAELDLSTTLGWFRESQLPPDLASFALIDDRAREVDHLVSRDFRPGPNLVRFGSLAELWPVLDRIEHFKLVVADPGQVQFCTIRLPVARSFTLHSLCWAEGLSNMLANAVWPRLAALELTLSEPQVANDPDDSRAYRVVHRVDHRRAAAFGEPHPNHWMELAPLLERVPQLERLALRSFANSSVLDLLDDAELPALVELDLSDSSFDRFDAERFARSPLAHRLRRLVLERVRLATPRHLASLPCEIVHSCAPAAPTYRYVVSRE
jgi:hypothetical protein